MKIIPTEIPGLLVLEPRVFEDERVFAEQTGLEVRFVQDNHSRSVRNVLRGLHYQMRRPQGKLVRVVTGEVFDVAVDLRRDSPTFGKWRGARLSADNKRMLWIPPGFAHGFLVLSDYADFLYKTTDYYAPEYERTIRWNDPDLAIDWPLAGMPTLSAKDRAGVRFRDADLD